MDERELLHAIRICMMPSEAYWDSERARILGEIPIPFGKYRGKTFSEVPLRYLDETISVMPPTWLVRRAKEFVDLVMLHLFLRITGESDSVPNYSLNKLLHDDEVENSLIIQSMRRCGETPDNSSTE